MIRNLTPHCVNVIGDDGDVVASFPSDGVARATQTSVPVTCVDGIDVVKMTFGKPVDLPDYRDGDWLIVSIITANAARAYGRRTDDLLITADPVRNGDGQIIGCRRFALV